MELKLHVDSRECCSWCMVSGSKISAKAQMADLNVWDFAGFWLSVSAWLQAYTYGRPSFKGV